MKRIINIDDKITNKDLFITNFKRFQEEGYQNQNIVICDNHILSCTNHLHGKDWAEVMANLSAKQINFFLEELEELEELRRKL